MSDQANTMNIALWNATGLNKHAIDSVLTYTQTASILFITETWVSSPHKYPTRWQQFHVYGKPRSNLRHIGQMGMYFSPS